MMDVDDRETAIPGELHKPLLCKGGLRFCRWSWMYIAAGSVVLASIALSLTEC